MTATLVTVTLDQALKALRACEEACGQARLVVRELKPNAGGDQYVYAGGMNSVESLRDALDSAEAVLLENEELFELLYPGAIP